MYPDCTITTTKVFYFLLYFCGCKKKKVNCILCVFILYTYVFLLHIIFCRFLFSFHLNLNCDSTRHHGKYGCVRGVVVFFLCLWKFL